jgi:RNA polymerase sigma-70 factor (ECF subfamily)
VIEKDTLGPFTIVAARTDSLPAAAGAAGPGDDERVRQAVVASYAPLWRFLRRMGVAEQDAEDAGQAVLVVFARKIGSVEVGAERSFLLGTALRVAADYRKSVSRRKELALGEAALDDGRHPGPDGAQQAEQRRRRRWLDHLLDRLAPELREVFVLVELAEMTMAESATVLDLTGSFGPEVAHRIAAGEQPWDRCMVQLGKPWERPGPQ